jgi:hypothetical protein
MRSVPFSHVASDYNADQLAKLTDAFNKAWPQVLLAKGASTPAQLEWLRKLLANHILDCASRGEFDPEKLSKMALRALVRPATSSH